jgi:serine/threonine-protein kinase
MSIGPGAQIGAFTVVGLIGQGGMGKVYRARDGRLKRDVALKVLPDDLASQPDRVARFQREAEILATLTHQNIAAIYGLEDEDGVRALVMEIVEGPTLADRIARGPIPVDEALPIARQMTEALDYAHEHGVLHRDLKPANIKVTPDGQVKILDFGLAKALSPSRSGVEGESPDEYPTITSPAFTQPGTILGTAAYMAPEQVRGKAVDKRADIWAFGCVLYEMLTGRRAFGGETVSDTLAAVLKNDPDWTRLPAIVPAPMRQLLEHCLERDPRERLRDIADSCRLLHPAPYEPASRPATPPTAWRWAALAASFAAALFAAYWYSSRAGPAPAPEPVRRVVVPLSSLPPVSTSPTGPALAVAPDGSAIAYVGRSGEEYQLFVHRLTDATTTSIRGVVGPVTPVFSPDSRWVAFGAGQAIWRAPAAGGQAEVLCTAPGQPRGGAWADDGRVAFGSQYGLLEVEQPGGTCRVALALEAEREVRFLWPQFLPARRGIILTVYGTSDDADNGSIVVVPSGTTERRVIVRGARAGRLTPSGHLLFARGHQILAAPFDLDRLAMTADPIVVLDAVVSGQFAHPLLGISDRGDLAYASGQRLGNRLVWVARDGTRTAIDLPRRNYQPEPRLSPDGRKVALPIGDLDHYLWSLSIDTGVETLVQAGDAHNPVWSPDSRRVAFPVYGGGIATKIAVKDLESAGEPEVVLEHAAVTMLVDWTRDGAAILFSRSTGDAFEVVALALRDRTTRILISARQPIVGARLSPDSRWIAYASADAGRRNVYVTDFPAAKLKKPVSIDGGFAPVWAHNGRELFYLSAGRMMAAAVRPGSSIDFDRPVPLFDGLDVAGNQTPFTVAPDGRFLMVEAAPGSSTHIGQVTLALNWVEELKRRVPAR